MRLVGISDKLGHSMEKLTQRQLLFLAAVISLLLSVGIYMACVPAAASKDATAADAMVAVITAKCDIPERTVITEDMVKIEMMPSHFVPEGALSGIEEAVGHPAAVTMQSGDIITGKKLFDNEKYAGFTGAIPPDCRAISVGITDITGVAGFAKPGDFVDVLLVSDKKVRGRISAEILLQNVMLLGINKTSVSTGDGEGSGDKKAAASGGNTLATATLAVSPQEAMKLAVAQKEGTIYLVLRPVHPQERIVVEDSYEDSISTDTPAASAPAMSVPVQASSQVPPALPAAEPSNASVGTADRGNVIIFRGTQSSTMGGKN